MITEEHIKEGLSRAYILAVAHRAGLNCSLREFDYGFDGTFSKVTKLPTHRYVETGLHLDFQAKATCTCVLEEDAVVYDLEAKNYNDLIFTEETNRILIVLSLPPNSDEWLASSEESLVLKNCAWWYSLKGMSPTENKNTVRIRIPRTQRFDVEALTALMTKVNHEGRP